ncbi:unnamed protein product [Sphagnum balticum]
MLDIVDACSLLMRLRMEGDAPTARSHTASIRAFLDAHPINTQSQVCRRVGVAVADALVAYEHGDYAECVRLLYPIRNELQLIGGSHAQAARGVDSPLTQRLHARWLAKHAENAVETSK